MKHFLHILFFAATMALCASCGEGNLDMLGMVYTKSDSSDARFEQSMAYNATHPYDTIRLTTDDYHFYVMTDIHIDFTTCNLDSFVHAYKADMTAAPFCLCLGDFVNATKHYDYCMEHVLQIASMLPQHQVGRRDTCYGAVGNHDLYYNQWAEYIRFYPASTYCFVVQTPSARDLYICLDSGNGTFGSKQRNWLRTFLPAVSTEGYRHIFCYTHTHFFKKDNSQGHTSNFAIEETYEIADLFSRYGVELVLQGHSHHRDLTKFKGVDFLRLDAIEDHYYNAFYSIFYIGDTYSWKHVPVGPQMPDVEQIRVPDIPY